MWVHRGVRQKHCPYFLPKWCMYLPEWHVYSKTAVFSISELRHDGNYIFSIFRTDAESAQINLIQDWHQFYSTASHTNHQIRFIYRPFGFPHVALRFGQIKLHNSHALICVSIPIAFCFCLCCLLRGQCDYPRQMRLEAVKIGLGSTVPFLVH